MQHPRISSHVLPHVPGRSTKASTDAAEPMCILFLRYHNTDSASSTGHNSDNTTEKLTLERLFRLERRTIAIIKQICGKKKGFCTCSFC